MIPISTDTPIKRTPVVNYALIAANVLIFVVLGGVQRPTQLGQVWLHRLALINDDMQLYQFFTHQFLHANFAHIAGNMLFLWVFGNAVNGKMGNGPYLLFYLACGVFAAVGHAWFETEYSIMVGASGAIAGVTSAYLALFPRSHVTILYWWIIITTFELPSMYLIVFKMILWDNIMAPAWVGSGNVATNSHLAGYAFGFAAVVGMLALRVLSRDQFDIVALGQRYFRRQAFKSAMADPNAQAQAQYGRVARPVTLDSATARPARSPREDKITELRAQIGEALARADRDRAARLYEELLEVDPPQVLSRSQQLEVANQLYTLNRLPQAAAGYEKFLTHYPSAPETGEVKLLLGIIYARDLKQYEVAEAHLQQLLSGITDEKRRTQCLHWLKISAEALGRPAPEA